VPEGRKRREKEEGKRRAGRRASSLFFAHSGKGGGGRLSCSLVSLHWESGEKGENIRAPPYRGSLPFLLSSLAFLEKEGEKKKGGGRRGISRSLESFALLLPRPTRGERRRKEGQESFFSLLFHLLHSVRAQRREGEEGKKGEKKKKGEVKRDSLCIYILPFRSILLSGSPTRRARKEERGGGKKEKKGNPLALETGQD